MDATQQGLEAGPEITVDVDAELETDADGGQVLVLRPDFEWLTADTTVYPVRIDPDVYTDDNATRTTYAQSAEPSTNYGSSSMLRVGWKSGDLANRSYLQWLDVARPGTVVKAVSSPLPVGRQDLHAQRAEHLPGHRGVVVG